MLPAEGTTDANPLGNSYGHGYTGAEGWKEVVVPLLDYGGQEVTLRFHYVTDDAIHGIGACLGDVALSWEDDSTSNRWEPDGFVRINNRVRQEWIVWVIRGDAEPNAERMSLRLDPEREKYVGAAGTQAADGDGRVVLAISPLAPATMERARYRVWAMDAVPGPPSRQGPG